MGIPDQLTCFLRNLYGGQEATVRYHYAPVRMAKSEALITPSAGKDVQQQELLLIAGGNPK